MFGILSEAQGTILPLFLASPVDIGGLNLDPAQIGSILGVYRICSALFLVGFCPRIVQYFGTRRSYSITILCCAVMYMIFPTANVFARAGNTFGVWACVVLFGLMTACLEMGIGLSYLFCRCRQEPNSSLFSLHLYLPCRRGVQSRHDRCNQWSRFYDVDNCEYTFSRSGDCAVVTVSRA